jgi:hypothetical protein
MLYNFIDCYDLNIKEFHDKLNENIEIRTNFYNSLNSINCVVLGFDTVNNEVVYTGESVNIFNGKDIYLTLLRKYKSWSLQVYSGLLNAYNLDNNCTDFGNTLSNFLRERRDQIQRIYEDYFINFSPIENTSVFNKETTTYSGNEKTTTTNTGSKTNTRTETGKENNTNIKSGSLTDNLDISGTERDTNQHSVSADNSNSLLMDTQDVDTKQFDARRDNRTETYNNVTDSNTKTFENRKSEDVESFNNYKTEQNKDFTNRKNEIELERHGNIGVTTNIKLLNDDINFRLRHNILNTVVDMFIAEYGFLA